MFTIESQKAPLIQVDEDDYKIPCLPSVFRNGPGLMP